MSISSDFATTVSKFIPRIEVNFGNLLVFFNCSLYVDYTVFGSVDEMNWLNVIESALRSLI
jgi:hypothetical protein